VGAQQVLSRVPSQLAVPPQAQVPSPQVSPAGQVRPQAPQLAGSLSRSAHPHASPAGSVKSVHHSDPEQLTPTEPQ
jgi:hypothetical protein